MFKAFSFLAFVFFGTSLFQAAQEPPKINWFRADGSINWEAEKQQRNLPTRILIIHHTAMPQGMTWELLSGIHSKMFVDRYNNDKDHDPFVFGQIAHSGHYRDINGVKVEVFYQYHWLIREDGSVLDLLDKKEVGWHAGDWLTNLISLALCFDGDFSTKKPPDAALATAARIIAIFAANTEGFELLGHNEVAHNGKRINTICPGEWFANGGKDELLKLAYLKKGAP